VSEREARYEIASPADPAVGATLRTFVREAGRRLDLDETDIEDLTLITTELLANAVEAGGADIRLVLTVDDAGWRLRVNGAGELRVEPDAEVDRSDILHAIADLSWDGGTLEVRSRVSVEH
jgi:anti-sigma regulatory factor (Ser/Thr protein kinase)